MAKGVSRQQRDETAEDESTRGGRKVTEGREPRSQTLEEGRELVPKGRRDGESKVTGTCRMEETKLGGGGQR